MKYILFLLLSFVQLVQAQSDKQILSDLKKSIGFLADDRLEGRRTGTNGEKLAAAFIAEAFSKTALTPAGDNATYIQEFEVKEGRKIEKADFTINGKSLQLNEAFIPMAWSGDAKVLTIGSITEIAEISFDNMMEENKDNPHFDWKIQLMKQAREATANGKKLVIITGSQTGIDSLLIFDKKEKEDRLPVAVIYLKKQAAQDHMNRSGVFSAKLDLSISNEKRFGHNVAGILNNKASKTIVIGAHYDHLGFGEDHNSLYSGQTPMIHNGADDNASGTAALIELSKILSNSGSKDYNYLFLAFSGEELGLYGSKYFTEHSSIDLKQVSYMINMDMVGRLNDSTHGITIGGFGTSPVWGELIKTDDPYFKIKIDSAGAGPSDHTSFYRKDIPVLFFFTGTHSDYHKPTDDADKINYEGELRIIRYIESLIKKTEGREKLPFSKTREMATGKSSFKVTMGIMPDYTFSGNGVLVDGVSDGKPAQKAGVKTGDIILQLGDHVVSDVQTYMKALNAFNKGQTTKVKIKRKEETIEMEVTF